MSCQFFLMTISCMWHVDFKKWPCRPVEFKGRVPHHYQHDPTTPTGLSHLKNEIAFENEIALENEIDLKNEIHLEMKLSFYFIYSAFRPGVSTFLTQAPSMMNLTEYRFFTGSSALINSQLTIQKHRDMLRIPSHVSQQSNQQ